VATLELITSTFGPGVGGIVRACSDSLGEVGQAKAPWRDRKVEAVRRMDSTPTEALLVIAADKLHNTRSTVADLWLSGEGVWDRFRTGRDGFLWYHESVLAALERRMPDSRSVRLLSLELRQLKSSTDGAT
jgi:(p)ppGpp synthase/HD superfamily hydrolase